MISAENFDNILEARCFGSNLSENKSISNADSFSKSLVGFNPDNVVYTSHTLPAATPSLENIQEASNLIISGVPGITFTQTASTFAQEFIWDNYIATTSITAYNTYGINRFGGINIGGGYLNVTSDNDNIVTVQLPANYGGGISLSLNSVAVVDEKQMLKSFIKSNLLGKVPSRQKMNHSKTTDAELKARDTLRDVLTEKDWRRYITNGFIMVKSLISPKWYQIFNDYRRINVYLEGKIIQSICIHTDVPECPPTDHILNMLFLVEHSEQELYKLGNVSDSYLNYNQNSYIIGGNCALNTAQNLLSYSQAIKKTISIH